MRLLALFFAVAALLLGVEAALNWWVDPFGSFAKPGAIDAARRSGCLLSQELVGNTYPEYKLALFERRHTRTFVIGSSRTVKISAHRGESNFTNMAIPNITPATLLDVVRAIGDAVARQTMYLGVEEFWFNPSFTGAPSNGWSQKVRYLLSANTFRQAARQLRRAPWELYRRWRRVPVGRRCVIGRTDVSIAWRQDGSRLYGYELAPRLYHPQAPPFTTDLSELDFGYFGEFHSLARSRFDDLVAVLDLARRRHWRVVGFVPPNPSRYARYLAGASPAGPQIRELSRLLPSLFHSRGFAWLDLRDVRAVPCPQTAFADGGFHPNAACSHAIRRKLDAAVQRER